MSKEDLDGFYVNLFDWLSREVVVGMYLGIAAALLLLGLVYVFARPRGIGIFVAVLALWLLPHTWIWYFAPSMRSGNEVAFLILVVSSALINVFVLWMSSKPTASETGQRKPLRVIATGTTLLWLYHTVQYLAVHTLENPPQYWWYWVRFVPPAVLLTAAAAIGIGTVYALVKRAQTKAPDRPFEPL